MPRMPGLGIAEDKVAASLVWDDRRGIARALAKMLVEAQTLTWEHSGKYNFETDSVEPFPQEYRTHIIQQLRERLAQAQRQNANTPDSDIAWSEGIITRAESALHAPYQPCIVLEDYKEPNTVVEHTNEGWRVSGVFDLMTAHFGDGEADLAAAGWHVSAR